MIPLTRLLAKQVSDVFRRGLGRPSRFVPLAVLLETTSNGFVIRARNSETAIAYQAPGTFLYDCVSLPFEALKACAGSKPDPVTIEPAGDAAVILRWTDRGIPQVQQFEIPAPEDFPQPPSELHRCAARILSALRDAADTTDKDSSRFALQRVRLRGAKGQVEATDSRQLFIENGFGFPWEDDILVTGSHVFHCPILTAEENVQIGRSDDWVTLVVGPWTIHLAIDNSGRRFPDVEGCIPATSAVSTALQLSEPDARFLAESISRLPSDDTLDCPVTVDLNGAVAVRSRGSATEIPTELILSSSSRTGDQFAAAMNRRYLQRAVKLGFREIQFQAGPAPVLAPAVCADEHRRYVWGLLDTESIVKPAENTVRIDSSQATVPSTPRRQNGRHRNLPSSTGTDMTPETTTTNNGNADDNGRKHGKKSRTSPHLKKPEELTSIDQTLLLQDKLRQALRQTREVLSALRKERKHARLMKHTLATLRQLQEAN